MMGKAIFITGTDTNVGKTVITALIAKILLKKGKKVAVYKPVQCGNLLSGKIKSPDLFLIKKLSGIKEDWLFNDYSFKFASSPHLAAELENKKVDVKKIKTHYKSLLKKFDYVLIEGAGGLLVPLTRNYAVLDLIKELNSAVIVVSRAGLGTINHTTMTLKLLKERKIKVMGVIFNYFKGGKIEEDNQKIISSLNNIEVLGIVPYAKNINNLSEESSNFKFL